MKKFIYCLGSLSFSLVLINNSSAMMLTSETPAIMSVCDSQGKNCTEEFEVSGQQKVVYAGHDGNIPTTIKWSSSRVDGGAPTEGLSEVFTANAACNPELVYGKAFSFPSKCIEPTASNEICVKTIAGVGLIPQIQYGSNPTINLPLGHRATYTYEKDAILLISRPNGETVKEYNPASQGFTYSVHGPGIAASATGNTVCE